MKSLLPVISILLLAQPGGAFAKDHDHDHAKKEASPKATAASKKEDAHEHSEGEEDHGHEEEGHEHKKGEHAEEGHSHGEGEEHSHDEEGHEHGEEEEEGAKVGPDKGITEANEKEGFKLSPEALKNFDLSFLKLSGKGAWSVPASAVVHSGEEVNLFRRRNGFFKRIDFKQSSKTPSNLLVDSPELREGDEIVTSGLGFLRIAELAATGGIGHGHSH
jgi:hypothetical protein